MRLEGIQTGDIVEVDRSGRRFYALVTGPAPGGLALQPTDRRINYYSCRSREVVGQARQAASHDRAAAAFPTSAGNRSPLSGSHAVGWVREKVFAQPSEQK
jgi:hypothetical protein